MSVGMAFDWKSHFLICLCVWNMLVEVRRWPTVSSFFQNFFFFHIFNFLYIYVLLFRNKKLKIYSADAISHALCFYLMEWSH